MNAQINPNMNIGFYSAMMLGVYALLPQSEKDELHEWEKIHNGREGTSDWPGWAKYIGQMPEVTLWTKKPIPPEIRWQIWERDSYKCQHCGSSEDLSIDHIFPEHLGGTLDLSNLQTLCRSCNCKKGTKI
jgi:hypothetical protein